VVGQRVGLRAFDRLETEGADAVELRLFEPLEQVGEILLGLAGAVRAPWPRSPGVSLP
jgi:hypothetical protein